MSDGCYIDDEAGDSYIDSLQYYRVVVGQAYVLQLKGMLLMCGSDMELAADPCLLQNSVHCAAVKREKNVSAVSEKIKIVNILNYITFMLDKILLNPVFYTDDQRAQS